MSELLAELESPEEAGADAEDTKRSKQAKAPGELKMVTRKNRRCFVIEKIVQCLRKVKNF